MFNQDFINKYSTIILIAILLIIVIIGKKKVHEDFHGLRPTKCFSCEKDLLKRKGSEWVWQGQVSKCFDCQYDLVKRLGPEYGALGGNNKTFNNPKVKLENKCKEKNQ